jgi:hypothetical protein
MPTLRGAPPAGKGTPARRRQKGSPEPRDGAADFRYL